MQYLTVIIDDCKLATVN